MSDKILTLHPDPAKKGVNIDCEKYNLIRKGILTVLTREKIMKPTALFKANAIELRGQIEGSIPWYTVTVKLDMEARKEIIHDRKKGQLWLAK